MHDCAKYHNVMHTLTKVQHCSSEQNEEMEKKKSKVGLLRPPEID